MKKMLAAAAALCLPATASALPQLILACGTLSTPGSYTVLNNLNSTADCLVIASDFVTLDLGGFVVSGSGSGNGAGITARGAALRGVTIRNGVVQRFAQGISMGASTGVTVERVYATGNAQEGILLGDMATVRDSTAIANGGSGVRVGQRGLIVNNNAGENGGHGLSGNLGTSMIGNTSGHNSGSGISTLAGSNVVHNVARNNTMDGIFADCPSNVVGNAATNNIGQNLDLLNGSCTANDNSALSDF